MSANNQQSISEKIRQEINKRISQDSSIVTDSQPMPTAFNPAKVSVTSVVLQDCPDELKSDFQARLKKGIETYGTPLQPFNGRDALVDAYEEMLDACQYLRQAMIENSLQDSDSDESIKVKCLYDDIIRQTRDIKDLLSNRCKQPG